MMHPMYCDVSALSAARLRLAGQRLAIFRHAPRLLATALTVVLTAVGGSSAQAADPMVGVRSLAMGDSLRGLAVGGEGMLINPSGIAAVRQFSTTAFYSLRTQSLGHFLHASVADSVTQRYLALGLYYNFLTETPKFSYRLAEGGDSTRTFLIDSSTNTITRSGNETGIVIGVPIGDRFAIGGTVKYGYYSLRSQLGDGSVPADFKYQNPRIDKERNVDMGTLGNIVTFDLGMTLRLFEALRLGVVGQNLWAHGTEMPTRLGIGLSVRATERLQLAADAVIDFTGHVDCIPMMPTTPMTAPQSADCSDTAARITSRFGGGLEYVIAGRMPLRLGYLYDSDLTAHHISGGLGYINLDPGFGIDFSFRQRVQGGNETLLLLGIRVQRE